ncbi:MAG: sugar ABC transporter substrate-binding protein [Oscillospiraceae bacterium]
MKKWFALSMAALLFVCLLAACGSTSQAGSATTGTTSAGTTTSEAAKVKLGIIIWGTTDALGRNSTMMVKKLVEQAGGEVLIDTNYTSPETQIQSAENLIAAGCNAILVVNSSDTMLPKLGQICEENEVYWGLQWRRVVSAEIKAQLDQYKYFVGNTCEEEVEIATRLAQGLADSGVKELAVITSAVGDTTHDMRNQGIDAVCASTDMERVAEYRGSRNTAVEVMEAVEKFITGYPNLDAIFLTGGTNTQLEGALAALDKHNLRGIIKIAVIDFIDADQMKDFLDDGTIFAIAGGHYVDPVFTSALLINAVEGNPLSTTNEQIDLKFIDFKSFADAENYYKYVENDNDGIYAYTDEELGQMIKSINPDLTLEDLRTMAANYSVEDVMARHGNS